MKQWRIIVTITDQQHDDRGKKTKEFSKRQIEKYVREDLENLTVLFIKIDRIFVEAAHGASAN